MLLLRRLVICFSSRRSRFDSRLGNVIFVVDEVALGQVFSGYFGFLCQFSFHRLLHAHITSGAGTEAGAPSVLSHPTPRNKKTPAEDACACPTSLVFIVVSSRENWVRFYVHPHLIRAAHSEEYFFVSSQHCAHIFKVLLNMEATE
jgi:hypothetical protein